MPVSKKRKKKVMRGYAAGPDGFVHWTQSMAPQGKFRGVTYRPYDPNDPRDKEDAARSAEYIVPEMEKNPVRKRDPLERVESLTKRLVDIYKEDPKAVEAVLKEIQSEYWKQGTPVAMEDLKRVAAELLNKAERRG